MAAVTQIYNRWGIGTLVGNLQRVAHVSDNRDVDSKPSNKCKGDHYRKDVS